MSKKSLLFLFVFFVFVQSLFSQINVLNPMPGNWANKQVLLIDTNNSEAAEYFYSVDGSSPKEFGFAYDGPVLLDKIGKAPGGTGFRALNKLINSNTGKSKKSTESIGT